ncbi:putative glutaredoxin [Neospora caninum Liverpool]|uniref:Glutaredoxin, putative n=1 Tax=Neospora caninum (strain Liverpool) TaxID=572307 RepID=F0VLN3_NEOCL|nr:putative glutaredoxin [Neospora caninum Liverpool]CBZ54161.1 putative glutaredoxin [Neospora caninum Liverpool]CEL68861.1 TPA: glutaredoxin, putative [Neospora caninum Liverpool]|eukprot:XP_003884192.1 putative glutaredoxin [Neospora caninum Liverpool]
MSGETSKCSDEAGEKLCSVVKSHKVVVFTKEHDPLSFEVVETLKQINPKDMHIVNIDKCDCKHAEELLKSKTGDRPGPRVFIDGKFVQDLETSLKDTDLREVLEKKCKDAGAL